jgi:hypothetical protein
MLQSVVPRLPVSGPGLVEPSPPFPVATIEVVGGRANPRVKPGDGHDTGVIRPLSIRLFRHEPLAQEKRKATGSFVDHSSIIRRASSRANRGSWCIVARQSRAAALGSIYWRRISPFREKAIMRISRFSWSPTPFLSSAAMMSSATARYSCSLMFIPRWAALVAVRRRQCRAASRQVGLLHLNDITIATTARVRTGVLSLRQLRVSVRHAA